LMKSLLALRDAMFDPWAPVSGDQGHYMGYHEIRKKVESDCGSDSRVVRFLDQYLRVLGDDRTRFIDRVGDAGGGQFSINMGHIVEAITVATVDNIVMEKFGSKALRIFRLIREKMYVEEGGIQEVVMIPAKETKLLTYQMMENNFIQLQELRKSGAGSSAGPSKVFYLFYVDLVQVVRSCMVTCYKSIYNNMMRAKHEKEENERLLEKKERMECIRSSLKETGGTEEQLEEVEDMMSPFEKESEKKVAKRLYKLEQAAFQTDETLFTLELYLTYKTMTAK